MQLSDVVSYFGRMCFEILLNQVALSYFAASQIFDATIITASFIIDVMLICGVFGEEGQNKAVWILIFLLFWRIVRVVDGRCRAYQTTGGSCRPPSATFPTITSFESQYSSNYDCCAGIVVTVTQRQEHRIVVEKRGRRVAEKKLKFYEEERLELNVRLEKADSIWRARPRCTHVLDIVRDARLGRNGNEQWIYNCSP